MQVTFLVSRYWPAVGGVEKYIRELGKGLIGMGHGVTVVAGAHEPGLPQHEVHEAVEVFRFPAYRSPLRCWCHLQRLRRLFTRADVVHISDVLMVEYYYRMLGWNLPQRPIYLTRHGMSFRHPVPDSEKRRAARAARMVDGTMDDGRFIAKWLQVPSDGTIDQGLSPTAPELEPVPEPPPHSAVFVGRLEWDSAITTYVDTVAVARQKHGLNISLQVYGNGPLNDKLRARVERDRLPVTFYGFVENAQERFSDGCFAFVSGRLAVQEAMARRRLVVATYVNQLKRDYICDEPFSPYLVVGADAEALADHVAYYAGHPEQRAQRVQQAFEYVKTLNWQRTACGYLRLWSARSAASPAGRRWAQRAALALQLCEEAG
ncbi:MAG: glycosyltransferase family 4 protein [Phycisphaerae bacterium]